MPRTIVQRNPLADYRRTIIGGNLLKNANFEVVPTGTIPTTAGKRWIDGTAAGSTTNTSTNWATGAVGTGANVSFDNTVAHTGSYSLRLHLGSTNSVAEFYSQGQYDTLSVMKDYAYPIHTGDYYSAGIEVTYWLKTNITSVGSTAGGATAGIFTWSGSGGITGGALNPISINTTTDWTMYRATFALQNAGVRFVQFRASFAGNNGDTLLTGDAWFDNVSMKMINPVVRALA